ncbi:Metallo-dependent phosphatase-like protein [Xylogone sp. PMI_703]|nr:Metallo-dependent phosphatase-like protein [Xylogone sp. PMI_703]
MSTLLVLACVLATPAIASQPTAPSPVAAPMRPLPWGNLNFLQTTDTHGWLAGHLQEAQYSADWGDYISFAERMQEKADQEGVDLIIIDTGDRVDGNGLYDASTPKGRYTYDIIREQHIDVLSTGNHELYKVDTTAREYEQTVPNFKGHYLASNLDYILPDTKEQVPMAQRWRKFTTKNQGIRIVAFGFIFNFALNNENSVVQPVEKTIQEPWFQEAIREDCDLFLVVGHVSLRGKEYDAIYKAIRSQNWDTPIQFFGGHSHIRDYKNYDAAAHGLQAGRYMETIGWMSIDGIKGNTTKQEPKDGSNTASLKFKRRYIDNNLFGYYYHTGLNATTFPTEHGKNVSAMIHHGRKALALDYNYGCAPKDFWVNRAPYPSNDSAFTWLETEVFPDMVVNTKRADVPRLAIMNTGGIRFDIFMGAFTRDTTYIVSPFQSKWMYIKDVPYSAAKDLLPLLNSGGQVLETEGLSMSQLAPPEQMFSHPDTLLPLLHESFDSSGSQKLLGSPDLIPGYTTTDDAGKDGDDTIHSPIPFYNVPNCIQSRISFPAEGEPDPEKVDLVFIDYLNPFVITAMKFLGQSYKLSDILEYRDESFTELLSQWIAVNWEIRC